MQLQLRVFDNNIYFAAKDGLLTKDEINYFSKDSTQQKFGDTTIYILKENDKRIETIIRIVEDENKSAYQEKRECGAAWAQCDVDDDGDYFYVEGNYDLIRFVTTVQIQVIANDSDVVTTIENEVC